jgi:hypothetical protein
VDALAALAGPHSFPRLVRISEVDLASAIVRDKAPESVRAVRVVESAIVQERCRDSTAQELATDRESVTGPESATDRASVIARELETGRVLGTAAIESETELPRNAEMRSTIV